MYDFTIQICSRVNSSGVQSIIKRIVSGVQTTSLKPDTITEQEKRPKMTHIE